MRKVRRASNPSNQAPASPKKSGTGTPDSHSVPAPSPESNGSGLEVIEQRLQNPVVLLAVICLLGFVIYIGTLSFPFVWDDSPQIVNNPIIRTWSNLPRAFGSDLWYHTTRHQVYYRPLFTSWSILNYSAFELKAWGWHLTNILVHLLAIISVFYLSRKLGIEYWTSALAALIFAVHPIHIECVAWVSAASDIIVTIFFVLAFLAFLKSRGPGNTKWLGWRLASLVLLAGSLFTKEMGLTFAGVVALYVWMYPESARGSWTQKAKECVSVALPYAVLTIGYLFVRKVALHHVAGTFDPQHGWMDMFLTLPLVLCEYLRVLVFPIGLTGLYYTTYVVTADAIRFVAPLLVLVAVGAGIWRWSRKTNDPVIAFSGVWMLVTLAPALYLRNFTEGDFVRDRYLYLPSVGFAILVAKGIRALPSLKGFSAKGLQIATACALAAALALGTYAQQVYWASDLLIFYRGHTLYPESDYATIGYASEVNRRGGYDQAIPLLWGVIQRNPNSASPYAYLAYFGLAGAYIRSGDKVKGREALDKAVALAPAYLNSEVSKIDLAGLYGQLGEYNRALALCADVLQKDPTLYSALYNCGNIHFLAGQYADAEQLLSQAVRSAPQQAGPKYFLGRVYLQTDRKPEAEQLFRQAAEIDPKVYDYHLWYGRVLVMDGKIPEAKRELSTAVAINSESSEAKAELAAISSVH